jgi:hypothetical protein
MVYRKYFRNFLRDHQYVTQGGHEASRGARSVNAYGAHWQPVLYRADPHSVSYRKQRKHISTINPPLHYRRYIQNRSIGSRLPTLCGALAVNGYLLWGFNSLSARIYSIITLGNQSTIWGNNKHRKSTTVSMKAKTMVALYISATVTPGCFKPAK